MKTREQRYAAGVLILIERVGEGEKTAYGSMAHQLPVLIRTAGLAQALAFVQSRRDTSQQRLLADLASVIGYATSEDLLKASRDASLADYMRITQNALAALLWFKRFAQSVLKVTADQRGDP